MRRAALAGAALCCAGVALAGCSTSSSATYAAVVTDVQAAYRVAEALVNVEIAAGKIPADTAAIIQTAEVDADPVVAALGSTTAPTTISAVLADAQQFAAALPAGTITTDVQVALLAAETGLAAYQASTGAVTVRR